MGMTRHANWFSNTRFSQLSMHSSEEDTFLRSLLGRTKKLGLQLMPRHMQLMLREALIRHLPERQVHLRTNGTVHYHAISPLTQFTALGLAFVGSCWVGIASANLVLGDGLMQSRENQIAALHTERLSLQGEIKQLRDNIEARTQTLEKRQRFVDELLSSVLPTDDALQVPDSIVASPTLAPAEGDTAIGGPGETAPATELDKNSDKLSSIETRQINSLHRIAAYVEHSTARLIGAIETTGLDTADVLEDALLAKPAIGGPFVTAGYVSHDMMPDSWSMSEIVADSRQLEELRYTIKNIPLLKPVIDEHYISSRYGGRRDPFKKSWAFHGGLDIAGHWKSPVRSTASGIVTFAGRKGAYGRMIEVDHQNGFRTRYGHLATILVKKGDTINLTDKIGLMGNSGRSTGTHLHYEIRYRGKPLNPSKFFKAAQHVQTI
jgi:hypothetical protein